MMMNEQDLIERLRIRAKIRREAKDRLSIKENKPDRLANLLDEAADEIERLNNIIIDLETYLYERRLG